MAEKSTILVSGMIAGDPYHGGAAWAVLQYVLGLKRLGHDVYFVEPIQPGSIRPQSAPLAQSENAAYFHDVACRFGLNNISSLLLEESHETFGLPYDDLRNISARADVLLNISGLLTDEELIGPIPCRIYLDLDPGFNQLWHATQGIDMRFGQHNRFVTIGKALGRPECPVPTCDLPWITTLQPVVLEQWPRQDSQPTYKGLTTVGNWRAYGSIEHEGVFYGQKAHSLRTFFDLPTRSKEKFFLAFGIHPEEEKDLAALHQNGWQLLEPQEVAGTPDQYRSFIQSSKAEFGIAKSGYVAAACGWFSDRSACYLASGRPVVAQDTAFRAYLPCGKGLFDFRTGEDVLEAIGQINADYAFHANAAREIAEEYFESGKVLRGILSGVGLC